VLALAALAAPGAAQTAARPTACSLLAEGLKQSPIFLAATEPDPSNNTIVCSRSDGKPIPKRRWSASLMFVPYPPAALEKSWKVVTKELRSGKPAPTRLRGFGADDAFASQRATTGPAGRLSTVGVAWRKGVYIGQLLLTRPSPSAGNDEDDIDDAAEILRGALRRLPRT
jgi:hypothetical protein